MHFATRSLRRRTATLLLAVWAMFAAFQAVAACCVPAHPGHSAPTAAMSSAHQTMAQDLCCDTQDQEQEKPSCPMAPFIGPSSTNSGVDYSLPSQHVIAVFPTSDAPLLAIIAVPDQGPARISAAAPPDPIFLRLQRFLI